MSHRDVRLLLLICGTLVLVIAAAVVARQVIVDRSGRPNPQEALSPEIISQSVYDRIRRNLDQPTEPVEFGPAESRSGAAPEQHSVTLKHTTFTYYSRRAKKVAVMGDFNNWEPVNLAKQRKDRWEVTLQLEESRHLYNFMVDNKIKTDPNNSLPTELSVLGFRSSVLDLREPAAAEQ